MRTEADEDSTVQRVGEEVRVFDEAMESEYPKLTDVKMRREVGKVQPQPRSHVPSGERAMVSASVTVIGSGFGNSGSERASSKASWDWRSGSAYCCTHWLDAPRSWLATVIRSRLQYRWIEDEDSGMILVGRCRE